MVRAQILLQEGQYEKLKNESQATRRSVSEIVRLCVDQHLENADRDPLLEIIGSIPSKDDPAPADLAERHDHYLYGGTRTRRRSPRAPRARP